MKRPRDPDRRAAGLQPRTPPPGNDREVLRWVTDQIMDAVMQLSGQEYVDAYGASVKDALLEGRPLPPSAATRPGEGHRVPPVPVPQS